MSETVEHVDKLPIVSVCCPMQQQKAQQVAWDVRRACPWARVEMSVQEDACVLVLIVCGTTFSDKNCAAAVKNAMQHMIPILAVSVEGYDKRAAAGALGGLSVLDIRSSRYQAALYEFFASAVVNEKLVRAVVAAQSRQNSASATIADLYLMGLGALEGIGGPRDCKRGCDMIMASTLAGLLDAKKQLAFMYRFGKGVPRDPQAAAKWTSEALVQAQRSFDEDPTRENTLELAGVYGFLASTYEESGQMDEARTCYEKLTLLWRGRDAGRLADASAEVVRVVKACNSDIRQAAGDAVRDGLAFEQAGGDEKNRERLSDMCRELVALYEQQDDPQHAQEYAAHLDTLGAQGELYALRVRFIQSDTELGDQALERRDADEAKVRFSRAVELCDAVLEKGESLAFADMTAYFKRGFLAQREGELDEAYRLYNRYSDVYAALYRRMQQERAEQERLAREQAEREEAERIARELAEKEEAERIARELAEKQEAERIARELAEKEEAERIAREQAEKEEAERIAREQAEKEEAERIAREQAEKEEAERIAREQAEKEEAERIAREQAEKEEAERIAQENEPLSGFAAATLAVQDFAAMNEQELAQEETFDQIEEADDLIDIDEEGAAEAAAMAAEAAQEAQQAPKRGIKRMFGGLRRNFAAIMAREDDSQQEAEQNEQEILQDADEQTPAFDASDDTVARAAQIEQDMLDEQFELIEDEQRDEAQEEQSAAEKENDAPVQEALAQEVFRQEDSGQDFAQQAPLDAAHLMEYSKTASNYAKMAAALEAGGNLERAMNWCAEAFKLRRDVYRASGSGVARAALGESVLMRARLSEKLAYMDEAAKDYADVVKLLAPLAANNEILSDAVASAYLGHGRCAGNAEAVRAAMRLWMQMQQAKNDSSYEAQIAQAQMLLDQMN